MDDSPEALLKSALEKIVYFEARSEQLHNDLRAALTEAERHKQEVVAFEAREVELRQLVAQLEFKLQRVQANLEEQQRLNEVMRLERTELIGKLVDASRLEKAALAEGNDDAFELASFISELRQHAQEKQKPEAVEAQVVTVAAQARPQSAGKNARITEQAVRLRAEGRLDVSAQNLVDLTRPHTADGGPPDFSLLGMSVSELTSKEPATRLRAAERLRALGEVTAVPALATALHVEAEPSVQVALLNSFAQLASREGVDSVTPLIDSPHSEVKMAALKALLKLDSAAAGPFLAQAVRDADAWVRRRASLLALNLSGDEAFALGKHAIADSDKEVRALAAMVLGASAKPQARVLLQQALRDTEKKVRQAAAQSLSRLLGQSVASVVDMDDLQRRREVRRIATLPVSAPTLPGPPVAKAMAQPPPALRPQIDEKQVAACMAELRMALRGRTLHDLAARLKVSLEQVEEWTSLLVARGQAVMRGSKYFAA